jgi:hypothetical protein
VIVVAAELGCGSGNPPEIQGSCPKRMKGLEPSTFCMAICLGVVVFRKVLEKWLE